MVSLCQNPGQFDYIRKPKCYTQMVANPSCSILKGLFTLVFLQFLPCTCFHVLLFSYSHSVWDHTSWRYCNDRTQDKVGWICWIFLLPEFVAAYHTSYLCFPWAEQIQHNYDICERYGNIKNYKAKSAHNRVRYYVFSCCQSDKQVSSNMTEWICIQTSY